VIAGVVLVHLIYKGGRLFWSHVAPPHPST
jgi:hypothetical protein